MTDLQPMAIEELPAIGDAAICMGVFDGVHRGHLALLEATMEAARQRRLKSVALVFDPHPDEIVRPGTKVARLAPLHENLRRLGAAGIDAPLGLRFDDALRSLTPEDFLLAMAPAVRVRALVMSPESAFGRDRSGTPEAMTAFGRSAGFEVVRVERLVTDGGDVISSGRIRRVLGEGDVDGAARLLGHPPYLEGTLGVDDGRRELRLAYHPALPAPGEYRVGVRAATPQSVGESVLSVDETGTVALQSEGSSPPGTVGFDLLARV